MYSDLARIRRKKVAEDAAEGVADEGECVDGFVLARLQNRARHRLGFGAVLGAVAAPNFAIDDRKAGLEEATGSCRERFRAIPLLCAMEPDSELTLEFEGKAVGAYLLAGPDAGAVEVSIDGSQATITGLPRSFG